MRNKRCFQKSKLPEKLSTETAGQNNSQKKTSFGSKKGKGHVMERNNSDEDSLDFDNIKEMREAMAKIQKGRQSQETSCYQRVSRRC